MSYEQAKSVVLKATTKQGLFMTRLEKAEHQKQTQDVLRALNRFQSFLGYVEAERSDIMEVREMMARIRAISNGMIRR